MVKGECRLSVVSAARDDWNGRVGLVAILQTHLRGPGAPGRGVAPDDDMDRMVEVWETCYLCAVAAAVKLHVVIPVYNEQPTLLELVRRVREAKPPKGVSRRLVIIDDGSSDGTASIVRSLGERPDVLVVLHERNRGKGAAVRSGFKAALDDVTRLREKPSLAHDALKLAIWSDKTKIDRGEVDRLRVLWGGYFV